MRAEGGTFLQFTAIQGLRRKLRSLHTQKVASYQLHCHGGSSVSAFERKQNHLESKTISQVFGGSLGRTGNLDFQKSGSLAFPTS